MDIVKSVKENPLQTALAALILASISGGSGAVTSLFTPDTAQREHSTLEQDVRGLNKDKEAMQREIDKLERSIADEARDRRQALFNQRQEFIGFLMRYASGSPGGGSTVPSMIELMEALAPEPEPIEPAGDDPPEE
jgi:hypothetical protein